MRTTLDLPDPLFRELKAQAAREGKKMKELIEDFVTRGLRGNESGPGRVKRSPLPPPRRSKGRTIPALSNAQIQDILDKEDAIH